MFEIVFSDKAFKQLSKLEKPIQKRIMNSLDRIRIRPEAYLTKLVDDPGYKLRVGDYRVIVDLDKGKLLILVIKVGHRRNVYQ
ncbi:MAG TPA: type II toxin-antitoxin system RelE/ParE family toxin [Candidatus Nanoarchaeia archaeon]|nr:type II toxin-antitoxin system RelE/ParE family toxin [Candidatus Nanoarchaeia archaeon]